MRKPHLAFSVDFAYNIGPVDKSKNSAETHRFSGRTLELEIEIDGIYHSLKV